MEYSPPKLVVVLVVDQMRADYLTRFDQQYRAGLGRLMDEGLIFENAFQDHAITATAAGHASISTGAFPNRHGVVSNSWWSREDHRSVYAVEDTVKLLDAEGLGSSPANLKVSGLGDWLKEKSPSSKVYSVALKDRAAVLMGGQRPDAAFWFHDASGDMITSEYYLNKYPKWLRDFNANDEAEKWKDLGWEKLKSENTYNLSRSDKFAPENDGVNTFFPHKYPVDYPDYYYELRYTPHGDELVFSFAKELIDGERLGRDEMADILFISASSADGIGHAYGPFSHEVQDYYLRLDEMIGDFLHFLDSRIGNGNYLLALSSDHGVLPMPEYLAQQGKDARRLDIDKLFQPTIDEVEERYNIKGKIVVATSGIYISVPDSLSKELEIGQIRQDLSDGLIQLEEIVDIFVPEDFENEDSKGRDYFEQFQRSFDTLRSPDITIRYREYYLPYPNKTFTSHESVYSYDSHIPIIFFGSGINADRRRDRVRSVDIAPTIAEIIRIEPKSIIDGEVLFSISSKETFQ